VKVLILGAEGMLGSAMVKELSSFDLIAPSRSEYEAPDSIDQFMLTEGDVVINCIGAIPQKKPTVEKLEKINGDFPHLLATRKDLYFIQIATDCVFAGDKGFYTEQSERDATDPYGVSKKRGEVSAANWLNLRCSIIGANGTGSLFDWVKNQPEGARINGFVNHYWNGVTTEAFARVVAGIMKQNYLLAGTQHLVPDDWVSKYDLVKMIAKRLGRDDIEVIPTITNMIDRRLATKFSYTNRLLWRNSRYLRGPMISEMVRTMSVE
jgi:dTDP-4-dehydrorhamnose reductase